MTATEGLRRALRGTSVFGLGILSGLALAVLVAPSAAQDAPGVPSPDDSPDSRPGGAATASARTRRYAEACRGTDYVTRAYLDAGRLYPAPGAAIPKRAVPRTEVTVRALEAGVRLESGALEALVQTFDALEEERADALCAMARRENAIVAERLEKAPSMDVVFLFVGARGIVLLRKGEDAEYDRLRAALDAVATRKTEALEAAGVKRPATPPR